MEVEQAQRIEAAAEALKQAADATKAPAGAVDLDIPVVDLPSRSVALFVRVNADGASVGRIDANLDGVPMQTAMVAMAKLIDSLNGFGDRMVHIARQAGMGDMEIRQMMQQVTMMAKAMEASRKGINPNGQTIPLFGPDGRPIQKKTELLVPA